MNRKWEKDTDVPCTPANESTILCTIQRVKFKLSACGNRLPSKLYSRPSSVQCVDWRAAETRHSSQVGRSPARALCDKHVITCTQHTRVTSTCTRRDVLVFNVTLVNTQGWQVMHQENRCFIPGGEHWGGRDNKHRCLHVVWYRLPTVCHILIGRSDMRTNEIF